MERKCPKCGAVYTDPPALSREDNETMVCPDCGVREAMAYMGIDQEDAEGVVEIVKKNRNLKQ